MVLSGTFPHSALCWPSPPSSLCIKDGGRLSEQGKWVPMAEVLSCLGSRRWGCFAFWVDNLWDISSHYPQVLLSPTFLLASMFSDEKPPSNCFTHIDIGSFLFYSFKDCFPFFSELWCSFAVDLFGFNLFQACSGSIICFRFAQLLKCVIWQSVFFSLFLLLVVCSVLPPLASGDPVRETLDFPL